MIDQLREMTDFQLLVSELAGDLIANGGDGRDVRQFVTGILGHYWRRRKSGFSVDYLIQRYRREWCARLAKQWAKKPKQAPAAPSTSVSGMVRENLHGRLEWQFRHFLNEGRIHELYFLVRVFESFDSYNGGADDERSESILAKAFMEEIDADLTFVKVPCDHVKRIEAFVRSLEEKGDEPAATQSAPELAELNRLFELSEGANA